MKKLSILILKNSIRNLLRNKRRTLLTSLAIIISTVAMLLIMDYNKTSMFFYRESIIKGRYGHVQIKKKGYYESESTSLDKMLSYEDIIFIKNIIHSSKYNKNIEYILPRINFSGLFLKEGDLISTVVFGMAIDPENEVMANPGLKYSMMIDGDFIINKKSGEVAIGNGLAKRLKINKQDTVYLYSVGNTGLPDIMQATVSGIFNTGYKTLDDSLIYAGIEDIQALFGIDNIHDIVLFLDNTSNTKEIFSFLNKAFKNKDFEIFSWEDLATEYKQVEGYMYRSYIITILIIILVLIFLSTNTILMSSMERINEFGTLRALGRNRIEISFMILFESIILGLFSTIIGIFIGAGLSGILTNLKIPTPPPPGSSTSYPLVIFFDYKSALLIFIIQFLMTIIASIYPMIKITKIKIIDALRYH